MLIKNQILNLHRDLAGIAFITITLSDYIDAITNNTSNSNNSSTVTNTTAASNSLITNILAKNLENHLLKAGAILNVTSKLPQVRNVSSAHLLNQTLKTLHGILSNYKDFQVILFIMPNGDMYLDEPYLRQQMLTTTNFAFRDYFPGVVRTHDIYLGDPYISTSSGQLQSVIAVPVYSLKDNSTLVGMWSGGIDFSVLSKELQSLNLTADGKRVVYVGHNGQKIADSDANKRSLNPLLI
jgi:Cache domain